MNNKILLSKGSTVKVQIKVKAKDPKKLLDLGLGPGILAEQEFVIDEDITEDNKIRFLYKRDEIYKNLLEDTIEPIFSIR